MRKPHGQKWLRLVGRSENDGVNGKGYSDGFYGQMTFTDNNELCGKPFYRDSELLKFYIHFK